jgi:hypothetical protein
MTPAAVVVEVDTGPVEISGWPVLPPTLLTIHRRSPADEQSRSILCALDGRPVADLLFGEAHTVEIPPGHHTLRVHNTLIWRTVDFEAEPGAHVHFTVWNIAPTGYYALIAFIGVAPIWLGLARGSPPA